MSTQTLTTSERKVQERHTTMTVETIGTRDWTRMVEFLEGRQAFKTHGALEGRETYGRWDSGRLPMTYVGEFAESDYAVFSYSTPIAYHHPTLGWVIPDVRYSVTTTRHQSSVKAALSRVLEFDLL